MAATDTIALIEGRLRAALAPQGLEVRDDSTAHRGHAGAREGGHYVVTVVSSRFDGVTALARHRMIYAALADVMPGRIHALNIKALAPGESSE